MDQATKALAAITSSGDYERVEGLPVFDAHDEYDAKGNLIRRFDRKKLEDICVKCNKRTDTGDLSPFGPGHTDPDATEDKQPIPYGFVGNYRVGKYGPAQKPAILADFYVKRKIETPEGNTLDGVKAFYSYPRRSVEYWPKDGFFDWVAILRRTPQRDLGVAHYSKEGKPAPRKIFAAPAQTKCLAAVERGGKLFYSMETDMDPLTGPADANAPDDAMSAKFEAFLKEKYPHLDAIYGEMSAKFDKPDPMAGDAPPMGDMPPAPEPDGDEKMMPFSKNERSAANRAVYLEKQLAETQKRLAAIEQERKNEAERFSKADAEARVDRLEMQGVQLDRDEEVAEFCKRPTEQRDAYEQKLVRYNKRGQTDAMPPADVIDFGERPTASVKGKNDLDGVLQYMRVNKVPYEVAVERFKK